MARRGVVRVCVLLLAYSVCLCTSALYAADANFIAQRALDPFTQRFGLPVAAQRLSTTQQLQLSVDYSNVFMGGVNPGVERLYLDGESAQVSLRYYRQLSLCWQFNASGEWVSHSGGQFDKSIEAWHSAFGLPNAYRDTVAANQIQFSYSDANTQEQRLSEPSSGLGDVQVQLQRYKNCNSRNALWRFGLKLPLGDETAFIGSSMPDYFIDWQSPWRRLHTTSSFQWAISAGLFLPAQYSQTPKQQKLVGFGAFGFNYQKSERLAWIAQVEWHTAFFNSKLTELGRVAAQGSLGFRYKVFGGNIEFGFAEDAVIDTAPDFVFRLAWSQKIN